MTGVQTCALPIYLTHEGWHLSGAIDLQEVESDGIRLSDYKTTGAWAVMNEKEEWHQQLNIYAWMVEKVKKVPVKSLSIVAIIRDWSGRDASIKPEYPQAPIVTIDIPVWPMEEREAFINHRIQLHAEAHFESDTGGDLPPCTPEEMWEKPTVYAVKKEGGVRAKSVHSNKEEAEAALPAKGYFIEVREGDRTRCANYCQVAKFCNQYQEYLSTKSTTE